MQFIVALMIFMVGICYTFRLKGEPFRALLSLRGNSSHAGALPPFAALSSALCGTLGVGSVTAVVSALMQGGAGVLAWLWLGALTGCSLKYTEICITMRHRDGPLSGAMVALGKVSPFLGKCYALLCLPVALLGMGNLTQVQVLSETLHSAADIPRWCTALAVVPLLSVLIAGGIQRIGKVASCALPVIGGVYIAMCVLTLWRLRVALPAVLSSAAQEVFHPHASVFTLGIARGLFISEAGMGTAAFAHSQSQASPRFQAALGVCEVLFSTLLCSLTALVVLVSGVSLAGDAADVSLAAFTAVMGQAGSVLLCVMIAFFALSTLPVWWFYGRQCAAFLLKRPIWQNIYTLLFLAAACIGCLFPLRGAWGLADAANLLLALPSLMMLLLYRRTL